jgi:hypothetical protein
MPPNFSPRLSALLIALGLVLAAGAFATTHRPVRGVIAPAASPAPSCLPRTEKTPHPKAGVSARAVYLAPAPKP